MTILGALAGALAGTTAAVIVIGGYYSIRWKREFGEWRWPWDWRTH